MTVQNQMEFTAEEYCISRISETKKGRFALFCADEFLFSVDDETLVRYHLKKGSSLSGEELTSVWRASETRKAKNKALDYLSLRDYGSKELYQKLCQKFDAPSSAAAIAEMQRLNLLNDSAFAQHRAAYLFQKGKSRREVACILQKLGISREILEEVLQEAVPQSEVEAICTLIQKKYLTKLAAGKRENVLAALARRGFSMRDCREAVMQIENSLLEEENETDETCNYEPWMP